MYLYRLMSYPDGNCFVVFFSSVGYNLDKSVISHHEDSKNNVREAAMERLVLKGEWSDIRYAYLVVINKLRTS
jgi:hypothetical protein